MEKNDEFLKFVEQSNNPNVSKFIVSSFDKYMKEPENRKKVLKHVVKHNQLLLRFKEKTNGNN